MPRQIIQLGLYSSVNEHLDAKLVPPGVSADTINGIFTTDGVLSKRTGYTAFNTNIYGGGTLSGINSIHSYKNELLAVVANSLYSYSDTLSGWINKGSVIPCNVQTQEFTQQMGYPIFNMDSVTSSGIRLNIWNCFSDVAIANNTGMYSVVDTATNLELLSAKIAGSAWVTRCSVIGGNLYGFWAPGGSDPNLYGFWIDPAAPTVVNTLPTLATNMGNLDRDIDVSGSAIAYETQSGLQVGTVSTGGLTLAAHLSYSYESSHKSYIGIYQAPSNGNISVVYKPNGASNIKVAGFASNLSTLFGATTLATVTSTMGGPTAIETSAGIVQWFWDDLPAYTGGTRFDPQVVTAKINSTTGSIISAAAIDTYHCRMLTRPFLKDGVVTYGVYYSSAIYGKGSTDVSQSIYFLKNSSGNILARMLQGQGIIEEQTPRMLHPSTVSTLATNKFYFVAPIAQTNTGSVATNGFVTNLTGPCGLVTDFNPKVSSVQYGESLEMANCGYLVEYDGDTTHPNNFQVVPEFTGYTTNASTGGNLLNGTYSCVAVYKWVDANNQVHISSPSSPLSVVLAGGTSSQTFTVYVSTYFPGNLAGNTDINISKVSIDLYITAANGNVYYLCRTFPIQSTAAAENSVAVTAITTSNPQIYIQGGEVPNTNPPAARALANVGDRLFLLDEKGKVWFTKKYLNGYAADFSELLYVVFSSESFKDGDIVNLSQTMDGEIIGFTPKGISAFGGDGPTDDGQNSTYQPHLYLKDVHISQPTTVFTDAGVYFISNAYLALLNKGFALQNIQLPIEQSINLAAVTSIQQLPSKSVLRFMSSDGSFYTFNYVDNKWSRNTGLASIDSLIKNNVQYVCTTSGISVESATVYADNGADVHLSTRTPWITVGNLDGYIRVWDASIIGTYKSPCKLTCNIRVDFKSIVVDTFTFTLDATNFSAGDPFSIRHHISEYAQKCTSIQFEITDSDSNGLEGLKLNAVDLEINAKKNIRRREKFTV